MEPVPLPGPFSPAGARYGGGSPFVNPVCGHWSCPLTVAHHHCRQCGYGGTEVGQLKLHNCRPTYLSELAPPGPAASLFRPPPPSDYFRSGPAEQTEYGRLASRSLFAPAAMMSGPAAMMPGQYFPAPPPGAPVFRPPVPSPPPPSQRTVSEVTAPLDFSSERRPPSPASRAVNPLYPTVGYGGYWMSDPAGGHPASSAVRATGLERPSCQLQERVVTEQHRQQEQQRQQEQRQQQELRQEEERRYYHHQQIQHHQQELAKRQQQRQQHQEQQELAQRQQQQQQQELVQRQQQELAQRQQQEQQELVHQQQQEQQQQQHQEQQDLRLQLQQQEQRLHHSQHLNQRAEQQHQQREHQRRPQEAEPSIQPVPAGTDNAPIQASCDTSVSLGPTQTVPVTTTESHILAATSGAANETYAQSYHSQPPDQPHLVQPVVQPPKGSPVHSAAQPPNNSDQPVQHPSVQHVQSLSHVQSSSLQSSAVQGDTEADGEDQEPATIDVEDADDQRTDSPACAAGGSLDSGDDTSLSPINVEIEVHCLICSTLINLQLDQYCDIYLDNIVTAHSKLPVSEKLGRVLRYGGIFAHSVILSFSLTQSADFTLLFFISDWVCDCVNE
ncbi:transcription factor SPT20 homolog isoform X2 [Amphibalanus amphitrite]|uniref:transcription factor SPT20 homolog isoform X2 n=1 Tax=Amphibalanus amphitrite TaxID=1232801 RepID=UPI001C910405|nr:transcription factor SPT20 homolog isoform X2 [Amphibalanus amphitrite]